MKVKKEDVMKRRKEMMLIIQKEHKVNVEELAKQFRISAVTVRRDLQYWEDIGAIKRSYGGASLVQEFIDDTDFERNRYLHAIAKIASAFVQDDDVIFINSSRTALMTLEYIKHKKVIVITNNAKAINYTPDSQVTVIFTGGEVRYPKNSMTGDFALKMLNNITATKCFIGCSGLTEKGISTELMKEMLINQTMINRTNGNRYILCDHTKIGLDYSFEYATFDSIDYLISDHQADMNVINSIKTHYNTKIIQIDPASIASEE